MRRLGEMITGKAVATSMRYAGLAIVLMQLVYVTTTLLSEHTTGIVTLYPMPALFVMLGAMVVLAVINTIHILVLPRSIWTMRITMAVYYLSVILFTFCVSSSYRDGVLALLWLIVLSTTGIMFGRRAFVVGAVIMVVANLANPVVTNYELNHLVSLVVLLSLTIYASYLFYRYHEVGSIELRSYNQLKRRERLQTRRLRALVNNLKDALVTISPEGLIQLYNPAALNLLDTNANLIGADADRLFRLVDENGSAVKLSEIASKTKITTERRDLRLDYGDKQYINLRLVIIPIRNQFTPRGSHELDGVIIMATDITKEKSLDDERDEFIGVVSHELRTPVAIAEGALSNLQLLIQRGGDPATFASTLDAAHKQILYLGQMVNDLATLSRAQRGVYMDNDRIKISDFMQSLYGKYQPEAKERHLRLVANIDVDGYVLVPSMVIEEIMQNLITNALKYTEKGSVTIGVRPLPNNKSHAEFYVKDSGIGISKSDMEHIFQRFWRSEDYRTRKTSGTGLGLHVVDQLARKINAKVKVTSRLNVGSTFSIDLPIEIDRKRMTGK